MSLALLKLASPKNLLRLATAYEETEESHSSILCEIQGPHGGQVSLRSGGPGEIEIKLIGSDC